MDETVFVMYRDVHIRKTTNTVATKLRTAWGIIRTPPMLASEK
jgi:hypothetical protein